MIFARALATEADILILDEPTSSLDLRNQGVILEWITHLSREERPDGGLHHPPSAPRPRRGRYDHAHAGGARVSLGSHGRGNPEEHLYTLYGVDMKRLRFEHKGRAIETFVPVYNTNARGGGKVRFSTLSLTLSAVLTAAILILSLLPTGL